MATKSYDVSKNFSTNRKGMIKDDFCFSPAYEENYDYKDGIVKQFHIGGVMEMKEPAYGQYSDKKQKGMARMEQDKEGY